MHASYTWILVNHTVERSSTVQFCTTLPYNTGVVSTETSLMQPVVLVELFTGRNGHASRSDRSGLASRIGRQVALIGD